MVKAVDFKETLQCDILSSFYKVSEENWSLSLNSLCSEESWSSDAVCWGRIQTQTSLLRQRRGKTER